jgi:hypothetical protein
MSETVTGYNGWRNYQTWNVALWINNDEFFYRALEAHKAKLGPFNKGSAKRFVYLYMPETGDGVKWSDKSIDWAEIVEDFNAS